MSMYPKLPSQFVHYGGSPAIPADNSNSYTPQHPNPAYNSSGWAPPSAPKPRSTMRLNYPNLRRCDLRGGKVNSTPLSDSLTEPIFISPVIIGSEKRGPFAPLTPLAPELVRLLTEPADLHEFRSKSNPASLLSALSNPASTDVETHLEALVRKERDLIASKKSSLQDAVATADRARAEKMAADQALEKQQEMSRKHDEDIRREEEKKRKEQQRVAVEDRKREVEARKEREAEEMIRREETRRQQDSVFERLGSERNKRNRSAHNDSVKLYSDAMLASLVVTQKESIESFVSMTEIPLDDDMLTILKLIAFARHFNFNVETMLDEYFTNGSLDEALSRKNISYTLPEVRPDSGDFIVSFLYDSGVVCNRLFDHEQTMYDVFVAAFVHASSSQSFHLVLDDGTKYTYLDEKKVLLDTKISPPYTIGNVIQISVVPGRE